MRARPRPAILAMGVVAVLMIASGTGAFSAMEAERSTAVDVVDDESAMLGLEYDIVVVDEPESEETLVTVTNRLPVSITVDLDVDAPGDGLPVIEPDTGTLDLSSGGSDAVTATVDCGVETEVENSTASSASDTNESAPTGDVNESAPPEEANESAPTTIMTVASASADLEIHLYASGSGVEVELTRTIEVVCDG